MFITTLVNRNSQVKSSYIVINRATQNPPAKKNLSSLQKCFGKINYKPHETNSLVIGILISFASLGISPCNSATANGKHFEYSEILQFNTSHRIRENNYRAL